MQTNKIIIGIIGKNASGKTTVTEYLKQKYGAVSFRFSDPLNDILRRLYLPTTRANFQMLSTILRQNFSEDILSRAIAEDAKKAEARIVVTEGVRRPTDITYLKEIPCFALLTLSTEAKTRFERLHGRREKPDDTSKTWEEFLKEENQESEQKIDEIAAKADFTLDNNGTVEYLYKQIDMIIKDIQKNPKSKIPNPK